MHVMLDIALDPERLAEGSPEERAAFGLFTVRAAHGWLTEGYDSFINSYRKGPLVSGYHAAEWFAWNWWRLRWEPRSAAPDWDFAHRMTSIGEGYVWPNLMIFSDGMRTALIAEPSSRPDARPFRYVGAGPVVVPSAAFEASLDVFISQILDRLESEGLRDTNLSRVWDDVLTERVDPDAARRRKLEACLGREPDDVDDDVIERLLLDSDTLGLAALEELAAHSAQRRHGMDDLTAAALRQIADSLGHPASCSHAATGMAEGLIARSADLPAWRLGVRIAQDIRASEGLGDGPVSNERLAGMIGTNVRTITDPPPHETELSFVLAGDGDGSKIVLRSRWETGRRFDLARLLGDRLMSAGGAFNPATRAATYRQKAQRAFAAELLSPFAVVEEQLARDYSTENQQDVADHFNVSALAIATSLKNRGRMPRDASDFDFDVAV